MMEYYEGTGGMYLWLSCGRVAEGFVVDFDADGGIGYEGHGPALAANRCI